MDNSGIDPNAGAAGDPSLGYSDSGTQGDQGSQNSNTPVGQGGQQQTDPRDAELAKYKAEVQRLNKAVIEGRRGQSRQNPQGQQNDQSPFATPEGQYAISLQLASHNLSRKLEDVYSFYPEIPASEITRIRKNPWAFASMESYQAGDYDTAALEVEQALLDRANEIAQQNGGQGGNGVPTQNKQTPATVNSNPATEQVVDANPGSTEDENLWTMPMEKLEKLKNKQIAQQSRK